MSRYFLELAYKGTHFKGFQVQLNANSIQGEVNRALQILLKEEIPTTTSSRTDAGVHAHQNFLHFDTSLTLPSSAIYNLNAILPDDILVKNIFKVTDGAHARFDALSRDYAYHIIQAKNPFLKDTAYHMPFKIDIALMEKAAATLLKHTSYETFSKRNTGVKTFECTVSRSTFEITPESLIYHVSANRFLRGMVRAIIGTLILVGRKKVSVNEFEDIIRSKDCTNADFSAPAHGLFLERVNYPASLFSDKEEEK